MFTGQRLTRLDDLMKVSYSGNELQALKSILLVLQTFHGLSHAKQRQPSKRQSARSSYLHKNVAT